MLFLIGCTTGRNNVTSTFTQQTVEQVPLMAADTISLKEILNPFNIIFSNNCLIISHAGENNLLSVYDIKSNEVTGNFIGKGKGPKELLDIQGVSKNEKLKAIALYDAITSKYIVCSIPDLKNGYLKIITSGETKQNPYKEQILYTNDSCITYLGLDTRLLCQNDTGQIINSFGDYAIHDNNEKSMWLTQIYKGKIAYNEQTNQYAIFDRLTDKVEFYDDYRLAKVVSGPDSFKEQYKIISIGGGYALGHYREKTHIAYGCIASNPKYILALYSGETFGAEGIHHNTIIQFNWDGKPIKIFKLNVPVSSFDVDWENNIIYGLNTENTPIILKYQM